MNLKNKNYYQILGLVSDSSVSQENIEKAYYRAKFDEGKYWDEELDEAYNVLSNQEKRKEYDKYLENPESYKPDLEEKTHFSFGSQSQNIKDTISEPVVQENIEKNNIEVNPKFNDILPLDKTKILTESGNITDIQTFDTIDDDFNSMNLDKMIEKLLSEHHNNYYLEILKLRYKNQINLLKKKLEIKKNQQVKRFGLTKYKLEITALDMQLSNSIKRLRKIEEKFNNYSKESSLSKLNKKIIETDLQIIKESKSHVIGIKKLEIKKSRLIERKNKKTDRIKLITNTIFGIKDKIIQAYDVTRNFTENVFVKAEDIELKNKSI